MFIKIITKIVLGLCLGFYLFLPYMLFAQPSPLTLKTLKNGWQAQEQPLIFSKQELFNYIDGAADIFYEFGFEKLWVQEYQKGKNIITLEIYQMQDVFAAQGIFLFQVNPAAERSSFRQGQMQVDEYQAVIQVREYFALLRTNRPSSDTVKDFPVIARDIIEQFSYGEAPTLPLADYSLFDTYQLSSTCRYVRGPLAFSQIYSLTPLKIFDKEKLVGGQFCQYRMENNIFWIGMMVYKKPLFAKQEALKIEKELTGKNSLQEKALFTWRYKAENYIGVIWHQETLILILGAPSPELVDKAYALIQKNLLKVPPQ